MKKRALLMFFLVFLAIIASLYFDFEIVKLISLLRNSLIDNIFLGITFASSGIIIFFVLTSLFLWKDNKRKWIAPLWLSLGASAIISFLLKVSVGRERPFQIGIVSLIPALQEASYDIWNFSFPSFQSMLAFCSIPILAKEYPKLKYFWIAFAVLVGFSRVYFGVHFLSDVIAGALIGYLIGMTAVKTESEYKFGEKVYRMIFNKKNSKKRR